jgi:quinol monooxygenase YgiN
VNDFEGDGDVNKGYLLSLIRSDLGHQFVCCGSDGLLLAAGQKKSAVGLTWIWRVMYCWWMLKNLCFIRTLGLALALMLTSTLQAEDAPYRHVVFFKFKDSATAEQVAGIEQAFIELSRKVDTVKGFEWGTNVSPEGLNDGFTHCFLVTFKDRAGLEVYLPHPAHEAFVGELKPLLDRVCVVDYVAK